MDKLYYDNTEEIKEITEEINVIKELLLYNDKTLDNFRYFNKLKQMYLRRGVLKLEHQRRPLSTINDY